MVTFSEISPSEFFYRNRDLAGFTNPARALYMAVRELVENSLDACELAGMLPDIYVRIVADGHAGENSEPRAYRRHRRGQRARRRPAPRPQGVREGLLRLQVRAEAVEGDVRDGRDDGHPLRADHHQQAGQGHDLDRREEQAHLRDAHRHRREQADNPQEGHRGGEREDRDPSRRHARGRLHPLGAEDQRVLQADRPRRVATPT